MKQYKIDTLISKGRLHDLHCEDDYLVYENDKFIVAAVFDGCSSGIDSHFASTMHKYKLREICENLEHITNFHGQNVTNDILFTLFNEIHFLDYKVNQEMLSTIVFVIIEKKYGAYYMCVAGDGCYKRPLNDVREGFHGYEFKSVHDVNGNAVWYLSTVDPIEFGKYYSGYCVTPKGYIENDQEICISSDGLESFVSQYGASKNEDAKKIFFETDTCEEKYQNMPLQRLYNVVVRGKCSDTGNEVMLNGDDFTMIKIKCMEVKEEETNNG